MDIYSEEKGFITLTTEVMQLLTTEQAWHYRVIPITSSQEQLECYVDENTLCSEVQEELEVLFGKTIVLHPVKTSMVEQTLKRFYLKEAVSQAKQKPSFHAVINSDDFVLELIGEAKNLKSSDIHIETYEERCRIRMRVDGKLLERLVIPKTEYPSLINKIKIMANLDIAEKRLPQDGRIFYNKEGQKFDIRVSSVPTLYGEKIVLRLLGSDASEIDITQLGFAEEELKNYLEGVKHPNGIMLISGPTGSGKTTTLYATLKLLNQESNNIITIEDPIEYTLPGINQVQLKEAIGLDFGKALRTFLRQDPDIIMVGEIRDPETANMAIRAALTGHLVLSTIHTRSAWGSVSRLVDMGIPSYLLATTLNTTVAQRLVRRLCPHCKKKERFSQNLYPRHFKPFAKVDFHYVAAGCEQCFYIGYTGRKAIYEVIPIDTELAEKIKNNEFEVSALLKQQNIRTLGENAFEFFRQGETSIEEVYPMLLNF